VHSTEAMLRPQVGTLSLVLSRRSALLRLSLLAVLWRAVLMSSLNSHPEALLDRHCFEGVSLLVYALEAFKSLGGALHRSPEQEVSRAAG